MIGFFFCWQDENKQKNEKNNAEDAHHQKIQNKFYAEKCIKKLRQIEQRTECKAEKCKGN